ncbi:uncharacterized protein LOC128864894 [Anastrepha ludens]|uniref:uncharacterized protein LOC128864894 n=1 Tax=Anastrepha ludens TaxID=28586 RepID=UPI0023AEB09F|nr:uncharacterized protein LOC128864894 [Anastrepha ludens]
MGKCDQQTRSKWNESLDYKSLPTWSQCTQVVERHCQFLHSCEASSQRKPESGKQNRASNRMQNSSFAITNSNCVLCSSSNHKLVSCLRFKEMNTNQRFDLIKKHDLCINCLGNGHRMIQCPSKNRCRSCNRAHHTLLHHENASQPTQTTPVAGPAFQPSGSTRPTWQTSSQESTATHSHMGASEGGQVILATAMILVKDATGTYKLGRALLDSCSQLNFITEDFAQKLRLRREKHNVGVRSIGDSLTSLKARTTTTIKSRTSAFQLSLQFGITSHIAYQPDAEIDTSGWSLPANTKLADEMFFKPRRIDLLLGTEAFFDALAVGQIRLGPNLPTLQKTLFGWVVSGRFRGDYNVTSSSCLLSNETSIDENLQRLWQLEAIDTSPKPTQPDHRICEEHFTKTTHQDHTGRITVNLPFKDNPICLGDSFDIARRRFLALERRLLRSSEIRPQYIAFMEEYESLGHMSVVAHPNLKEPHYYMPHHCVLKPSSTSTKLRVVFDASCRTSTQTSLNDHLLVGPTIQQDLYMLLLRFRLYRFAITADITKMYRQVLVENNCRQFQYILWRASPDSDLRTYQLNTVTYGTASAPYLAVRSLHYLADQHMTEFPIGASAIKSSFYVDDMLCGADDITTLHTLRHEVVEVLRRGQFPISKWHSNHPDFKEGQATKELHINDDFVTSALGVTWHQRSDVFSFGFSPKQQYNSVTKRTILSIASSLFDPLGLLSPLIITAKIILQELWLLKLDWDESVPQHLQQAWTNCLASLNSISSLIVPRYCLQPTVRNIQIHGFCDASIRAYGCSVYIRTEDLDGHVEVQLFTSRSRVAPVKRQSLPKLELCSAHLLASLYAKIKDVFTDQPLSSYFWTDSQLVLHWLQQHSITLSTFVGNRVSDIQELTVGGHWRYVPTRENPADLVSRGCPTAELKQSTWFSGPAFLFQDQTKWPNQKPPVDLDGDVINSEKRKTTLTTMMETNYILNIINGISSYPHCLRLVAWLFRFFDSSRKKSRFTTASPSPDELRRASHCLIWNVQQHHFSVDFQLLKKNRSLKSNLKFLTPFIDTSTGYELIKVGGRLDYTELPDSQKHPLLLPKIWPVASFVRVYLRVRGKTPTKSYLAIFVCLVTKAVHIEVVSDLSTKAFLNALKRMGGRRKMPCHIFCDNATNFVGASNHLQEVKQFLFKHETQNEINKYCSSDFINFHFIPPRAPHFGGLWEAAVKSAKGLLYRTLANTRLTYEELSTVAVEIEAILNSRPLSPLSSDPNDFEALTAGHFLVGSSLRALPESSLEERNISNLDRYDMITAIKQRFWRRWSSDYVNELRSRVKWTTPTPNLAEGTLVIIHDDNLPSQRWKLGRVESTVRGRDGHVRVVRLRTTNGSCCRPVHKLAILPVS